MSTVGSKPRPGAGIKFDLPPANASAAPAPATAHKPVTGLGLMTAAVAGAQELERKVQALQEQVKQAEAERGAVRLDPQLIRPSRWANRHESSFAREAFQELKRDIESAGGNVQPIMVRRATGEAGQYEVVFGHRRHRACLELNMPVTAVVQDVGDHLLFENMERENRARDDLSPWEQGVMYRRALDAGLYPSQRKLAESIGRSPSDVSTALQLADLPAEIVAAFPAPTDLQFRWAKPLRDALEGNAASVLLRARQLQGQALRAGEVFRALTEEPASVRPSNTQAEEAVSVRPANTQAAQAVVEQPQPLSVRPSNTQALPVEHEGARQLSVKFDEDRYRALRLLAMDLDASHQAILVAAFDAYLKSLGR